MASDPTFGLGSALGGLISGAFGMYESNENRQMQKEFNRQQLEVARQNMAQQKEFAQHGLSWKVADAVSAGLHPLIGAGASGTSFSPVSVGGEAPKSTGFSAMGQGIERAVKAALNNEEREDVDTEKARKLQLENAGLQNEILKQRIASESIRNGRLSGQLGPPMPVSGRIPLPRPGPERTITEGAVVEDDKIKQKAEDYPQTKTVRPFGYPLLAAPAFNDGQQFEDRYGESELGSTIKFGVNTLADHAYTGWQWFGKPAWAAYDRRWLYKRLRGGG